MPNGANIAGPFQYLSVIDPHQPFSPVIRQYMEMRRQMVIEVDIDLARVESGDPWHGFIIVQLLHYVYSVLCSTPAALRVRRDNPRAVAGALLAHRVAQRKPDAVLLAGGQRLFGQQRAHQFRRRQRTRRLAQRLPRQRQAFPLGEA